MKTTDFNEIILDQQDVFSGLYSGKITSLNSINLDDCKTVNQFNQARQSNADPFPLLHTFEQTVKSIEEFDKQNQEDWFMPDEYKNFDIENYLLCQAPDIQAYTRVEQELELFRQHNFIMVLKYLKYLVDTMRKNNIVWGVGRGSSVASYCLYLLGIHRVDSIKYELDIQEFLKGELK
jgi:DNA polymerase III alpha subunit